MATKDAVGLQPFLYRVDTHLGSRVVPPPDFTTRTTAALNKIAKEHWRRQMAEEDKERAKEEER